MRYVNIVVAASATIGILLVGSFVLPAFGQSAGPKTYYVDGAGPGAADTKTFVVDVSQILEKGKIERDLPLEPGAFASPW